MFVGTFEHSLDDKGRMVLPAVFRGRLADGGYVTKLDRCLAVWTNDGFTRVAEAVLERVRSGQADRKVARSFSADAHQVSPDQQGRVVIPQRLREFAGLQGEVVVNGALDHIEVWDAGRWNEENRGGEESLAQPDYSLADLGI